MAGISPAPSSPPPAASITPDPTQYWCYQCNKRVPVETLADHPDVICFECKNGFVESIAVSSHDRQLNDEETENETPAFGNEFLHILRLIAMAAREDDEPPPPPPPPLSDRPPVDNDYVRIELDRWNNGDVIERDGDEADLVQVGQVRAQFDDNNNNSNNNDEEYDDINNNNDDEDDDDEEATDNQNENEEEDNDDDDYSYNNYDEDDLIQRERRDVLRLRLRDFASRAASRRNRILDWAEILMGLEDQSVEFRLQVAGEDDVYVGNPGDYVDAAGYEALLQTLAESDSGGRRGAPPAAKSAVEGLLTVEVKSSDMETCAICKDRVFNCEGKVVKQLECGHMYHGECIVCWLDAKNSCPVCRFELPTDDPEYEEDRKKRSVTVAAAAADRGCSSSSGGAD
ncbi:putative transcription factor C2H2 family [Helianthus annuus]|uniref:RING-type E3 ubiquitin transferase n=1 Tax=Helianthus annuus TaxID=4232 RepID=A0A251T6H0_HELAN|nr:E3 ubiquitin-protein ligase CIP8 [Helianthus annuus]KAF5780148.1 putative transcription factor C2H2 family [Helianthus annuus]KAJ0507327.1 putative transcription factor C2H2 family [Helianthus annuus]KAJ0683858.1 putative transcription factor C2H2 family [Helianthus annuus]